MKLTFISLLLLTSISHATTGEELLKISKQFQNRNWHYNAAVYARQAHLIDYSNVELLEQSKSLISIFVQSLQNVNGKIASLFYPESGIKNESDRITIKNKFVSTVESYDVLLGWDSFLTALDTEEWNDSNPGLCAEAVDPSVSEFCGRETKGNWAIANLTDYQRQSISTFKDVVIEELTLIQNSDLSIPIGPGAARVFQFLFDSRVIPLLLQRTYSSISDETNLSLKKVNSLEILRALIIQTFREQGGELVTSGFKDIFLENTDCESKNIDCQLQYIRSLFLDENFSSSQLVTNLILDKKIIKPFLNSLVASLKSRNLTQISREELEQLSLSIYLSICELQGLDPFAPDVSAEFKFRLVKQLKLGMNHLILRGDVIGLQLSKGLYELINYIEEF